MTERETRQPNLLERLSGSRWFGHGRILGIQRGSVSERIEDPYYKDIRLLSLLCHEGQRVPLSEVSKDEEERIIQRIAEQINQGTASYDYFGLPDRDLIAFMNHELKLTGLSLPIEYDEIHENLWIVYVPQNAPVISIKEIKRGLEASPLSTFQAILSQAITDKSLRYVARVLAASANAVVIDKFKIRDSFVYRGKRLEDELKEAEVVGRFIDQEINRDNFHIYSYYAVDKVTYEVTNFEVIFPLVEAVVPAIEKILGNPEVSEYTKRSAQALLTQYRNCQIYHAPGEQRRKEVSRVETNMEWSRRVPG